MREDYIHIYILNLPQWIIYRDHKVPRDVCRFELKKKNDNGTFAKDIMNVLKKSDLQKTQRMRKSQGDRMNNKGTNTIV